MLRTLAKNSTTLARGVSRAFSTSSVKSDFARMTLYGRIGNNLESKMSKNNTPYLQYALAVGGANDSVSWYNVTVFDENTIQYLEEKFAKGQAVVVEANASMRSYETEDGRNVTSLNLIQKSIHPVTFPKREVVEDSN
ncbi:nucleic acid-binding protein [Nadsonia fulvescens var. elongata DSM 6958]|uniref:Nucleic acid-binding protein n=1 Tax=Nadsonia fulvescens var. elongata DSM 6958 TaxID=857566 RepID=A0A1E3PG35_9ASCO|nr:nucleic acid-binding protein [Nadsonia fulvescens var. elongata DSM 6958]